jgi:hypothetical protein
MSRTYLEILNSGRAIGGGSTLSYASFSTNSEPARRSLEALNQAFSDIQLCSHGITPTTKSVKINAVIDVSELPIPDDVDIERIAWILVKDPTNNRYYNLQFTGREKGAKLDLVVTDEAIKGLPRYYYREDGKIYILPLPEDDYEIKIDYKTNVERISVTNLTDECILTSKWYTAFERGVAAYLRLSNRYPDADVKLKEFQLEIRRIAKRLDSHDYKASGENVVRLRSRKGSRSFFRLFR